MFYKSLIKKILITVMIALFCYGCADWQMQAIHEPEHGFGTPPIHPVDLQEAYSPYQVKPYGVYSVVVHNGSIKNNLARILRRFGWRTMVWSSPYDYSWVGPTTIYGNCVQDIVGQMLASYPIKAVFYQGNHVVLIKLRVSQ